MSGRRYEVRVRGRVGPAVLASFDGWESAVEPVETVLHGPVRDQAELHGMIARVQALGLELVEVRRLPPEAGAAPPSRSAPDGRERRPPG